MHRFLVAACLFSALTLPLAAHADSYDISNFTGTPPLGLGQSETLGAGTLSAGFADATITFTYTPTGSLTLNTENISFDINLTGGFGTETILQTGTLSFIYEAGFESSTFTLTGQTITGANAISVADTYDVSSGPGTTGTLFAELYPTPVAPTPEPDSLVLLGTGILGVAGVARRKLLFSRA
jgi:PEP-CTERM motif